MQRVIYPELSYRVTGALFKAHNELGRYSREKQYCDYLEKILNEEKILYKREYSLSGTGNRLDFLIEDKIAIEAKAKGFLTKEDYHQIQRYLQCYNLKLGLLVNFHQKFLKPKRIIRIDTDARQKFLQPLV